MINGWLKSVVGSLFIASALLLTGCGGESGTQEVTGTVSFEGEPVKKGQIVFEAATVVGADIADGKFAAKVPAGKHKVRISATREEGVAPDGLPNYVPYIPKKYNDETTLEEEVKAGKNEFKFDLTK